jgi:hypothetical protein
MAFSLPRGLSTVIGSISFNFGKIEIFEKQSFKVKKRTPKTEIPVKTDIKNT